MTDSLILRRLGEDNEIRYADNTLKERELKYLVLNAASRDDAFEAVRMDAPEAYRGLKRKTISFDGVSGDGFEFSVQYPAGSDSDADDEEDGLQMSFDCSGGTRHVNYAIAQRRVFGQGEDKAGKAINWNGQLNQGECEVSGVDVPCGQIRISYTRRMRFAKLSTKFMRNAFLLTGTVNAGSFKGWERGEVMFLGMSFNGTTRGRDLIQVSFHFLIQPNEYDAKIEDIPVGFKEGFHYLWALEGGTTGSATDSGPKVSISSAYLCQPVPYGNFNVLGL